MPILKPSHNTEEEETVKIWNTPLLVESTAVGFRAGLWDAQARLSRESPEISFCSDRRVIG